MDFGWMIDYTCCTILWMKNTPTHPELAGWLAGWLLPSNKSHKLGDIRIA